MSAYDAAGKRNSSKTHARHGHVCDVCGQRVYGNGGKVAHGRKHARAGEVIELVKWYSQLDSPMRVFVSPDTVGEWIERGFAPAGEGI